MIVSTLVGLPGDLVWQDELLPLPVIPVDTTRDVTGIATVLQQPPPSEMGLACMFSLRLMADMPWVIPK